MPMWGNNPASWVDPYGLFLDGGVVSIPTVWWVRGLIVGAGTALATDPTAREAAVDAFEHLIEAGTRFPENAANIYGQIKDFFAPDPVMMNEIDDGEDASSVTPTDDDEVCEVDPGKKPPINPPPYLRSKEMEDMSPKLPDIPKDVLEKGIPEIKGHTKKLRNPGQIDQIKKDMLEGNYEFEGVDGIIAGVEDANGVIHLTEGQHRMNAALEIFEEASDPQYVHQLLESARRGINGRTFLEKGPAPTNSRKLPRRSKSWWKFW